MCCYMCMLGIYESPLKPQQSLKSSGDVWGSGSLCKGFHRLSCESMVALHGSDTGYNRTHMIFFNLPALRRWILYEHVMLAY